MPVVVRARAAFAAFARRALLALLLAAGAGAALAADPQIASLVDEPDPVPAGGVYEYRLRIDNNAADAATNTVLDVAVPLGASFVSSTPGAPACAPVSPTLVRCTLGTVGGLGADVRNIVLRWRALGPGPSSVGATATLSASNDTNAGNNVQTATTTVISGANMSLAKADSPDPVVGGANVTYTLTVTNNGPNDGGAIRLTDNLPPSVSFVSAAGAGWSCSHAAGVVTCDRSAPVANGAAAPVLTIVGRVNASGGVVTNTATVLPASVGGIADPDTADNTATADTTVLPGADIRIAQKIVTSALPAVAGANVTFRIDPRNGGPAAATAVVVRDTLPAGWSFVSASGPNWSCSNAGPAITCSRPTMPTSAADDITVVATAPPNNVVGATGTVYTNTASIEASSNDPNPGNNSGSVNVNVLPDGADLRLLKTKTPNPVAQGANMSSTIRVANNGPRVATGPLRVVEVLSGETFVSASGGGWSCSVAGNVVTCDHPNASGLGVGDVLPTLTIVTTATSSGTVSNTACTGGSVPPGAGGVPPSPPAQGDPNGTNDCVTASSTSTTVRPDLSIGKLTSTPTGGDKLVSFGEDRVTYTLVVSNVTPLPATDGATGIRVVDTVPAFITGRTSFGTITVTPSGGSTAVLGCTTAGATVTCTQSGGILLPGQTLTIAIPVLRPLQDGNFTNTATVTNTAEGDPNASNNSASDTVTIEPIADVEMTGKTVLPSPVRAGQNATYVLSFRNNGPSTAQAVTVTDSFAFPAGDSGLTVIAVSSTKPASSCSISAGAVLDPASSSFSCTIGTLANGETQSITLVVRPNFQGGNAARVFDNSARVNTSSVENPSGGDNGNNVRTARLNVSAAEVDLLTNKTDLVDPVPFAAGATFISYRVRVTSNGPSFATNVRVTERMTPPSGKRITFVCDTTTFGGSTCNPTALCSVANVTSAPGTALPDFACSVPPGNATTGPARGDLAPNQSKEIYLRFRVEDQPEPTGDIFNNQATVLANEPDNFPGNDTEGEATTTRQRVDLRLQKTATPANVSLNQPFSWVLAVENRGPGNSLVTDVTDVLPAGVQVTGPITWTKTLPAASGTCTLAGSTVTCNLGLLSGTPVGNATITIPARITAFPGGGTLTNNASIDVNPDKTGGIDTPGGNNTGSAQVTVTRSSLSGLVFQDRDRSGSNGGVPQAAGTEPRIGGVSIRLTGTDAFGNAVDRSTTTLADGSYTFGDLAPSGAGGYTLTQTQPAGFVNGPVSPPAAGADAPSNGGTYARGGVAGDSSYTQVVLPANTAGVRYNFPEVRRATLAGTVYVDVDASGGFTSGTDLPIPNATVRLLEAGSGNLVATATTGSDGSYSFTGLDPLVAYSLEEPLPTAPAGLMNGPVNPGLIDGAACASGCTAVPAGNNAGADRINTIDLSAGSDGTGFNFGEVQLSFISGLVWVDTNRNNALDPSETQRLSGVTLRLVQGADCASGTELASTTSAADGSYRFDNVRAYRSYLVCETQPPGYGVGSANGVAGSNVASVTNLQPAGSANNNFGETLASLASTVFQDTGAGGGIRDNGLRDGSEPGIANVPVTLSGTDILGNPVSITLNTDSNGNVLFDGLIAPNAAGYTLTEGVIPPAAGSFVDGRDSAGTAGGTVGNDVISAIALAAGQQATAYQFGELPSASISGTVFIDRNGNDGIDPTPTDGRLPGVTLTLVQGASCSTGTVLQTTQTDAAGNYAFNNVAAGASYLVCQQQPPGYGNGVQLPGAGNSSPGANVISINNLPAGGSPDNHFGERVASLSGSVYADFTPGNPALTNNGVRDAGEAGIAGVTIALSGTDINGAPVTRTTTTDASGDWRFADLLQSNAAGYTVTEGAIPPGAGSFNDGRDTAGTINGSSVGSAASNDQIGAIVLPAGASGINYLFGELPVAPITGTVYIDRDRDGVLGGGDGAGSGIPGVTVRLVQGLSCTGTELARSTTGADGSYSFAGVSAGLAYTVCEEQPAGFGDGSTNPGTGGATSPAPNAITIGNLPAAGSSGNNFGERVGSVAGGVFLDANNDGIRQGGDAGIPGVTINLSGTDAAGNPVNRTTTTDANGNWRFDDLLAAGPGGYTVTEQATQPVVGGVTTLDGRSAAGTIAGTPSGTASTPTNTPSRVSGINLPPGGDSVNNNFAEILPVGASGSVFLDLDNNGVPNPGGAGGESGIPGVRIVLTGTDDLGNPVTREVPSGADGSYAFAGLRPGTYTITQPEQPAGTSNGITTPGSGGGTATPVATLPSAVTGINLLTPGSNAAANNFAEIPNNSAITGTVWLDADNNGRINGSEAGIAGVTVELSGTDSAGRPVARSTTTGPDGHYSFDNLGPGAYTVREPQQPPATVNGQTVAGSTGGSATPVATLPSAIAAIPLAVGQTSSGNDFGELPVGEISGRVWGDSDNDGLIGNGEGGIAGVVINLTGTDDLGNAVSLTTTTGPDGSYRFGNLRPGTYTLTQPTQPPGTVNGRTVPGTGGGTATGPAVTPSAISGIVLGPGGRAVANNFGEIGNSPDLRVSKALDGASTFTVGFPGRYRITVRNVGEVATSGVYTVRDRLPAGLTLAATPTGTGWACVGAAGASSFSCTSSSVIAPGAASANVIGFSVNVAAAAQANSPVMNAVLVEGGGELPARGPSAAELDAFNGNVGALPVCTAAIEHDACRTPTPVQLPASVSGAVWYETGPAARVLDGGDRPLAGWQVEIVDTASGTIVGRATTGNDGRYVVPNLLPGVPLAVRFREPGSGIVYGYPVNGNTGPGSSGVGCNPNAGATGQASSCVEGGANPALSVVLAPGQELQQQSLPVDPSGVVYDSGLRQPVPGSIVTLAPVGACAGWNPATGLLGANLGGYTVNGGAVSMTVGADGFYQYLFTPAAPASCTWSLTVTPPAGFSFESRAIPPAAGPLVPNVGPGQVFPVQPQATAPTAPPGSGTTYYLTFNGGAQGANIIHNHIPLDPALPTAIALSKVGDRAVAEVGDSIRYTITVRVTQGSLPRQTTVVDRLPAGFTYIRGTAVVGTPQGDRSIADPISNPPGGLGPNLAFNLGAMPASGELVLRYRVRVGVGAQQGDGINRARAQACGQPAGCVDAQLVPLPGSVATNEAAFRVRVSGGVFTTDACVLGKIFVDCNNNHVQDKEELGIPGVRFVMQDGTTLVSDSEGKYSICGLPPRSAVLKADPLTLPRGSRLATSSNRNLGDAGSLWLDLKNGELHRADFIEGSCSNTVLEQVKARRAQGEVRAPETERKGGPALRFDSKAHGLSTTTSPQQGTDGANQRAPKPRAPEARPRSRSDDELDVPTHQLPMNQPPPSGRDSGQASDAGASRGSR